jgi:hypothetical protein
MQLDQIQVPIVNCGLPPRGQIAPLDATIARFRTLSTMRFEWQHVEMARPKASRVSPLSFATRLMRDVCELAGEHTIVSDGRASLTTEGVVEAIRRHDDATLFGWLMGVLSYQGVSDAVAFNYMEQHGRVAADAISKGLARSGLCPKLESYWQFHDCGYRKSSKSCAQLDNLARCPLPRHDLRNGHLNQAAYSLFLFMRDVAQGDFVAWIDRQLADADRPSAPDRCDRLAIAVVEPLSHIYGVSHKVLSMSLSMLLLAGDPDRERWQLAGGAMIAIDTLVHNWLHRSGILKRFGAAHLYGPRCYADAGCADIVRRVSRLIDARTFNSCFPKNFPRFVQHAIWRFCSQNGLNECNGNRIDDLGRCDRSECGLYAKCGRLPLHKATALPPLT